MAVLEEIIALQYFAKFQALQADPTKYAYLKGIINLKTGERLKDKDLMVLL
jgi:hypothetical protein